MTGHSLKHKHGSHVGIEFVKRFHNKSRHRPTHPRVERRSTGKGWYGRCAFCSAELFGQVAHRKLLPLVASDSTLAAGCLTRRSSYVSTRLPPESDFLHRSSLCHGRNRR